MEDEPIPLVLPELGVGDQPIQACTWLVNEGAEVSAGDRLLEVLAASATIDLPAPVDGLLIEQSVAEGDTLHVGQVLGLIEPLALSSDDDI